MTKQHAYEALVNKRKECTACGMQGYMNQCKLGFDTDQIGNFSTWANDLDADLMIVAQDFSNQYTFKRDKGQIQTTSLTEASKAIDYSTATNFYLRELTKRLGRDIGLPTGNTGKGVFLTNAVLCLKRGAMNAAHPTHVIANCGKLFLKPLLDIVQPKVIVTLGAVPARSVLSAYQADYPGLVDFLKLPLGQLFRHGPFYLGPDCPRLFPMYHPGRLGQAQRQRIQPNSGSGWELMKADWDGLRNSLG